MGKILKSVSLATLLTVSVSGCATFQQANTATKHTARQIKAAKMPSALPVVQTVDTPWLMGSKVRVVTQTPDVLKQHITLVSAVSMSLHQVAAYITQITDIPVQVQASGAGSAPSMPTASTAPATVTPAAVTNGSPAALESLLADYSNSPVSDNVSLKLNYHGSLKGLLDVIQAQSGYWWNFKNGEIHFFTTETKTFLLPAFAGETTSTNSISASNGTSGGMAGGGGGMSGGGGAGMSGGGGGMSGGGMSGGGTASISNTTTVDAWKNMAAIAKTVSDGATVYVDSSLGTITVTGTPPQVEAVSDWVSSLSKQMSRQIAIEVHVYDLDLTNEQNYGLNPSVAFNDLAKRYGVSVQGVSPPAVITTQATPLTMNASILSSATGALGQWKGSNIVIQALATMGKVVSNYSRSAVTMNGQPAAIQVATNTGYLESTSTTLAANVGSTASLTPGLVTTGFTAFITPRIIGQNIYLGINLTISSLTSMQTISSGGQSIQTPDTESFAEQQEAKLKSGDILVLAGYQSNNSSETQNGTGSPRFPLFGGGGDATTKHRMIIITVTARNV